MSYILNERFIDNLELVKLDDNIYRKDIDDRVVDEVVLVLREINNHTDTILWVLYSFLFLSIYFWVPGFMDLSDLISRHISKWVVYLLNHRVLVSGDTNIDVQLIVVFVLYSFVLLVMSSNKIKRYLTRTFKLKHPLLEGEVNRKSKIYLFSIILSVYLLSIIPMYYIYHFSVRFGLYLVNIWAFFPSLILLVVIICVEMFLLSFLVVMYLRKYRRKYARIRIIAIIVELISDLVKNEETFWTNSKSVRSVARNISSASNCIRSLSHTGSDRSIISLWSFEQMELAANNFNLLAELLYIPQKNGIEVLKNKLYIYLDIFCSGNYKALPRVESEQFAILKPRNRFGSFGNFINILIFLVCLAIPIILSLVFVSIFKLNIPANFQTPITILYLIWVALCIIVSIDKINIDKSFLLEVLKILPFKK